MSFFYCFTLFTDDAEQIAENAVGGLLDERGVFHHGELAHQIRGDGYHGRGGVDSGQQVPLGDFHRFDAGVDGAVFPPTPAEELDHAAS